MDDGAPSSTDFFEETITVSSGMSRHRILMGLGLIGLFVAATVGVLTLRSSTSASGGADNPEEAVRSTLEALGNEDMIGAAEMLLPAERRSLTEPLFEIVEELKRLEILDPGLDMSNVAGIDFDFADVVYEVETLTLDLAVVRLLGGQTSAAFDPAQLPLGRLVLDRIDRADLGQATRDVEQIEPGDDGIAVVRRDGRWYVSLAYSVAEVARRDSGLPLPDPSLALVPRGAATAEDAVESMLRAGIELDARRILELLPPDEAAVVHDYAPLFLADVEAAAARAHKEMKVNEISVELDRLDLSSSPTSRGHLVTIDGFSASVTSPVLDAQLDITESEAHVVSTSPDGWGTELHFVDGCVATTYSEPGQRPVIEEFCEDDVPAALDEMFGFGELPDFDIFTTPPRVGILAVEVDGDWYVSPLGTLLGAQVDTIAAIDGAKLEALIDWVIDFGESFAT